MVNAPKLFSIENLPSDFWLSRQKGPLAQLLEKILSLHSINQSYQLMESMDRPELFFDRFIDALGIDYTVSKKSLERIPEEGPIMVVANHPFGALEGLVLGTIFCGMRRPFKFLGNYLLQQVDELENYLIPVDPFGHSSSSRANIRGLREAIDWLAEDGILVTFPAGAVSHLHLRHRSVVDPPWNPHIAAMIRRTQATVLPIHFFGRNSNLFQILGLTHSHFHTLLLPRELAKKRDYRVEVCIGRPVPFAAIKRFSSNRVLIDSLRLCTYQSRVQPDEPSPPMHPIVVPALVSASDLVREIHRLPSQARLAASNNLVAYVAAAPQIPSILEELAHLRESTFRKVGEGTGLERDTDDFDEHYLHLFIWDEIRHLLVGAYRLGLGSEIIRQRCLKGFYTSTLFHFKDALVNQLAHSIELGRSFIRPEFQRRSTGLALLWRGIGELVVRNLRYRWLFGPVSISRSYSPLSRELMVEFLRRYYLEGDLAPLVQARYPFQTKILGRQTNCQFPDGLKDINELSQLVAYLEEDGKGVPVLLRQYLKLNARFLGFNVDPSFSNVIDGLVIVDLTCTEPRLLKRFMGYEGMITFRRQYGLEQPS